MPSKFNGEQLPTKGEVLGRYFKLRDEDGFNNCPVKLIADQIYIEMKEIYRKAGIETQKKDKCVTKIVKLYSEFREKEKSKNNIENLNQLFDISSINALKIIENCEIRTPAQKKIDIDFLMDQSGPRIKIIVGEDTVFRNRAEAQAAEQAKQAEEAEEAERAEQAEQAKLDERAKKAEADDYEYVQSRHLRANRPQTKKPPTLTKNKPINLMQDPGFLSTLDRANISNRKGTMIAGAAYEAMDIDIDKTTCNFETMRQNRTKARSNIADDILKNFKPPKRAVVHFDGKMLRDLSGDFSERLAVMISGDTCKQGKLLSARAIEDGSGQKQADEVMKSLEIWNCKENIVAQCFDTTSSNTGWLQGAVVKIEEAFQEAKFW